MYYVPKRHIVNNAINQQEILMPSSGTINFKTNLVLDMKVAPEDKITTDFYEIGNKGDVKQISPRNEHRTLYNCENVINYGQTITNRPIRFSKNGNKIIENNENPYDFITDGENEKQSNLENDEIARKGMYHEKSTFKYFVKKNPIFICSQIFLFMIFLVLLSLRYEIDLKIYRLCKYCLKAIYKKFCKKDTVKIHVENNDASKTVPENNDERLEGHMYFINGFNNNFIAD
ncbi:hypothetical protein COBT_002437 [Conglomerata obtusa]